MNREARAAAEELAARLPDATQPRSQELEMVGRAPCSHAGANQMLPRVNAILLALVPDAEPVLGSLLWQHRAGVGRVLRAEDVLGDWDEMVKDDGEVQFGVPLNALDVKYIIAKRLVDGQQRQAVVIDQLSPG